MRKRLNILAALVLGAMLVLLPGVTALAEDATLTLQMTYAADKGDVIIDGATATAYRVAELDDAVNLYTLAEGFEALDVDFNVGMDAAQMDAAAQKAAGMVAASGAKGVSATSNAKGEASFGALPYGVYLVMQTSSTGTAASYEDFRPFLISVPQITQDGVVYQVLAIPKTEPKPPAPPEQPPTTGDTTNLGPAWAWLGAGAVLVLVGVVGRKMVDRRGELRP